MDRSVSMSTVTREAGCAAGCEGCGGKGRDRRRRSTATTGAKLPPPLVPIGLHPSRRCRHASRWSVWLIFLRVTSRCRPRRSLFPEHASRFATAWLDLLACVAPPVTRHAQRSRATAPASRVGRARSSTHGPAAQAYIIAAAHSLLSATFDRRSPMTTPTEAPTPRPLRALTPLEARIVGVLIEKQHTVPDTYPLSLNALAAGCSQKTARSPVMNVSEAEVLSAIEDLKQVSLVFEGSSSRVPRFEHNLNRVLGIPSQAVALLTVLLLRGAQTGAELRLNSARLHGFADVSSVESFLDELAERTPPLVVKLPRAPGERESRWMHLLCGEINLAAHAPAAARGAGEAGGETLAGVTTADFEALRDDHDRLVGEVARLRALVERMAGELGIDAGEIDAGATD
ncbi:hypothetical protein, DUF480 family [Burkholderia plantarii]|uniref:Uncharacterized protein n=2 Tax=Burkholderia plantarii TaxID=41899 RepID=A0A0B6RZ55_BURPL|nr:hypothetical protein, DUF480 family [Burkholderia plantarii]